MDKRKDITDITDTELFHIVNKIAQQKGISMQDVAFEDVEQYIANKG